MTENSMLSAVKIQSRIVIPIVKALERELGRERAHEIVGEAIAASYVEFQKDRGFEMDAHPAAEHANGSVFPIVRDVTENTENCYGFDVKGCQFAEYFRSIGEPEIGALMTCGVDFAAEELVRPGWRFERSQTRMEGASHCDFRWQRDGDESQSS